MDRRTALKNMSVALGGIVATPTVLSLLASCTDDVAIWKPDFFSSLQQHMVTHLVDIIIPTTQIPGALGVNVPQFIDKMYQHIELPIKKKLFTQGAEKFATTFEIEFSRSAIKGKKEQFNRLLDRYFNLSESDQVDMFTLQKKDIEQVDAEHKEQYLIYKFLLSVRYYTLFGYYTSEKVGEEILNYDPVPGVYHGCVPLADIGNAWSIRR